MSQTHVARPVNGAAGAAGLAGTPPVAPSLPRPLVIVSAARLFTGRVLVEDAAVVIAGHTIIGVHAGAHALRASHDPAALESARVLSFPNATILPGLIDAHVHLALLARGDLKARAVPVSDDALLSAAQRVARAYLARGVTTIRDLGDRHRLNLRVRDALANGVSPAPRVLAPGRALHRRNQYGSFIGIAVDSEPALLAAAEQELAAGADFLKIIASGIIDFQGATVTAPVPFTVQELRSLVAFAGRHGKAVAAHASGAEGVAVAVRAGVTTLEHGFFATAESGAAFARGDCTWVPTFIPVEAVASGAILPDLTAAQRAGVQGILDRHAALLREVHAAGGAVIAGSDAGSPGVWDGGALQAELRCFQHAGLSPEAALARATHRAAGALGIAHLTGSVEPGKRADLLVVEGDPLRSLDALENVRLVLRDGVAAATWPGPQPDG